VPRRAVALLVLVTVLGTGGYLATTRGDGAGATVTAARPPPAAAAPAPVPGGTRRVGLAGGRSYLLSAPSRWPGTGAALPLLVVVHGKTGDAERFAGTSGFAAYAERGEAVVAFPDATAPGKRQTSWNAGTCCEPAVERRVDDVSYLAEVIADVSARTAVDPLRTWYVGFSNGAMMGYRLACERPDLVDAVVAVAGSRVTASCAPGTAVPFLHIHGDRDATVPLDGTAWSKSLGTALPSAAASVQPLATVAGCRGWAQPDVTAAVVVRRGVDCRVPVEVARIVGLTHRWDPRETTLAWSFFTAL
jgi:polyhydroxybutyrate depolymerase